ncbi:MAG: DUF2844 domain-containing protein [Aquincola sp.]|nr:DUF2844 domain-containing protein [Aquincola sp.]MDH4289255.1 DUF2844 domain-containing protein [Aquincola sp.]MDH5331173.1 DUF2844 domain-containing protein [Aquincola sp.]
MRRIVVAVAALLTMAGVAAPAHAALGEPLSSVQSEQAKTRASRSSVAAASGASVQELRLADGSSIRQYVNAQGIVFAVAWSTRIKPDFGQWLGHHAATFDAAVADAARQPGLKRSAMVDQGDLVVQSFGRPGAFNGKAWLKSQLPSSWQTDAIR